MMSEQIRQVLDKLKGVREHILVQDGEAIYDCNFRDLDEAIVLLEQAGAEQAQPAAGEFTSRVRNQEDAWRNMPPDPATGWATRNLLEACNRLDAAEAEKARLGTVNDELNRKVGMLRLEATQWKDLEAIARSDKAGALRELDDVRAENGKLAERLNEPPKCASCGEPLEPECQRCMNDDY